MAAPFELHYAPRSGRATIHRGECRFCVDASGLFKSEPGYWFPLDSYEIAVAKAKSFDPLVLRDCALCRPTEPPPRSAAPPDA